MSRRDFIKASVAAAAAATAGLPVAAYGQEDDWRWDKGVCRFCGVGCGIRIATHEGKVVAIQGDRENTVNRGLLCVKGYANAQ
ncbi:MAG: twin-arginine translocation signal domain-containing protein, partial [Thermoanaerobaculia bacterium]